MVRQQSLLIFLILVFGNPYSFSTRIGYLFANADASSSVNNDAPPKSSSFRNGAIIHTQKYKLVQVHIIHRHGDRTPITPLKDREFWSSQLISNDLLQKMDTTTRIIRSTNNSHSAKGRRPFGLLTQLGLLQMIDVGSTLREQLLSSSEQQEKKKDQEQEQPICGTLFNEKTNPMHPQQIRVISTDFDRTIQSVQGTLMGLFPELTNRDEPINVDVRHTSIMIPDPQPRNSQEQIRLERLLSQRPNIREKERDMKTLKEKTTASLLPLLDIDACGVSFGVGEEKEKVATEKTPSLSWSQLSEITKCLQLRNKLPTDITPKMQQSITDYTAWKWFSAMRNARLAYLAMHPFCQVIVQQMQQQQCATTDDIAFISNKGKDEDDISNVDNNANDDNARKQLYLYSAHDSTLIGLLCAFHLEQPAEWPPYGSYFKIELIEKVHEQKDNGNRGVGKHFVRFSLNNKILKPQWNIDGTEEERDNNMISLDILVDRIASSGATPQYD